MIKVLKFYKTTDVHDRQYLLFMSSSKGLGKLLNKKSKFTKGERAHVQTYPLQRIN